MTRQRRRLAAILFADVVGSSRLIARDESGTVARLLEHLTQRLAPFAARHDGRVVRLTGDGGLVEFASAVDALAAAIEFQQAMAEANRDQPVDEAISFRLGIHIGDVIVEHNDIYGDDVNVAARLQEQAPPGGIVVSRNVWEAVAGRHKAAFEDMGDLDLKNIGRPIQAFRVRWHAADWPAVPGTAAAYVWPTMGVSRWTRLGLWAAATAGCIALAGAAYVAFAPRPPPTLADLQTLKAEDLERLLVERRAADAAAAEKKRLEEEAQRKAEADADALRQAVADLDKARLDRQKAEADLAELKLKIEGRQRESATASQQQLTDTATRRAAEDEAHRIAEVEMASLRQVEQEALQKAVIEAENKRLADEALAKAQSARQKADEEATARRRAEEKLEATAKQKADAEAAIAAANKLKGDAETAEAALHLALADRQHLQVALTSLGFDTRGTDGRFGPRSRDMIAAWQKKIGASSTGFLTAAQRTRLFTIAAPAIAQWDDERRKAEEARSAVPPPPVTPPPVPTNAYDGAYSGARRAQQAVIAQALISGGKGSGTIDVPGCNPSPFSMTISLAGDVGGRGDLNCPVLVRGTGTVVGPFTISGRAAGRSIRFIVNTDRGEFDMLIERATSTANAP